MLDNLKQSYFSLSHWQHILIWLGVGIICCVLIAVAGGRIRDAWQLHEYNKVRAADIQKAQLAEAEAQKNVGIAVEAVRERDAALQQADELHKRLDEAEKVLEDASKTTAQKREILKKLNDQPVPVISTGDQSINDFCARAKQLGLTSTACQ